jgi:hypothetical protein
MLNKHSSRKLRSEEQPGRTDCFLEATFPTPLHFEKQQAHKKRVIIRL